MKKKILITGSAGFLFGNYIRRLIYLNNKSDLFKDYDLNIVSIDLLKSNAKHSIYNNKNHTFYIADIRDKHILNTIFNVEKPDVVIHGANESYSSKDIVSTNVSGAMNVIDKCLEYNSKLIYISETDLEKLSITSSYFATKLCAENIIRSTEFLEYTILRLPELYGPKQSKQELIPQVIMNLTNNIPVYIANDGLVDRLHVFDACSAINSVLLCNDNKNILNASADDLFSDLEVAQRIQSIMLKQGLVNEHVEKTLVSRLNAHSYELKKIGWNPEFNLNNSLNDHCVQWYIKNNWFLK